MSSAPVFFDPSGRRRRFVSVVGALASLLVAVALTFFVLSMLAVPLLPPGFSPFGKAVRHAGAAALPRRAHVTGPFLSRDRVALRRDIALDQKRAARDGAQNAAKIPVTGAGAPIVAAFYAPWTPTGLPSLRHNAGHLTHVIPVWLHLNSSGAGLSLEDFDLNLNPGNREIIALAKTKGFALCPLLSNAQNDSFNAQRVHLLLSSPARQTQLIATLKSWLLKHNFQGLNVDFENLDAHDYERLASFMAQMRAAFAPAKLSLSADLESNAPTTYARALGQNCNFVVLMAYDQHSMNDEAGPLAGAPWVAAQLARALTAIAPQKLVMGVGNYALDWADKTDTQALSYQAALFNAADNRPDEKPRDVVDFDPQSLNATYQYQDQAGRDHEVWMLDAASAYNSWKIARDAGLRGTALWSLGNEDPALWQFLRRDLSAPIAPQKALGAVHFPYEVEFQGEGEMLSVAAQPTAGERHFDVDHDSGLITDERYATFPSPYVMKRSGARKKQIALTFDDGPDPQWTPQILAELKQLNVKATFFVVGENAEAHPALVSDEWDAGHEIGNHSFTHPNLGITSPRRTALEINATQRAIECILGRSTRLFRPPYNADAEPETAEQVTPVADAAKLGYVTVGESLDPQDWNANRVGPDGSVTARTVADLHSDVYADLARTQGNCLLLHDAGGDRSKTLLLLRQIVPELQKRGYRFVTVSQLMGTTRDGVMPQISLRERALVAFDNVMFNGVFGLQRFLVAAFVLAIGLGIARTCFITPLAFIARAREKNRVFDVTYAPLVTVLIAAYNERAIIERTIRSVLDSSYGNLEVIVIDDGSKDGTADEVAARFGDDARVLLLRQQNGGKAAALGHGLGHARGEIFVGFDADTQIDPAAIGLMVRHFDDPTIAAVAGNVKVGNRLNLLTRWQALEYITSQNLDRRAYGLLNAITVVPGAIGAWRIQAVRAVGGYVTDTLAEDMDLTWRLRRAGWRSENEARALAFTEAPDTLKALFKQRFRWSYGTLQCLCKHRGALGRAGWFGALALPTLWVFQVGLQLLAPCVDLQLAWASVTLGWGFLESGVMHGLWIAPPGSAELLSKVAFFYALFFAVELGGALIAFRLDREKPGLLWWLFWQRFVYRQLLYVTAWKSLWMALGGVHQGWNKLVRKGTVNIGGAPKKNAEGASA